MTGSVQTMDKNYRNSTGIYNLHPTMLTKPFVPTKQPKFYGTLGYLMSTILLLVALLPHSGKFLSLLYKRHNTIALLRLLYRFSCVFDSHFELAIFLYYDYLYLCGMHLFNCLCNKLRHICAFPIYKAISNPNIFP